MQAISAKAHCEGLGQEDAREGDGVAGLDCPRQRPQQVHDHAARRGALRHLRQRWSASAFQKCYQTKTMGNVQVSLSGCRRCLPSAGLLNV